MIIYKIALVVCVCIFADCLANDTSHDVSKASTAQNVTLVADQNGHFTGNVLINQTSMPFMIDTGATITTIPMQLAVAARLPLGKQVEFETAGGRGFGKTTSISSLKIGTLEIKNIDAHANPNLPIVLIGMNTLKYFEMRQSGNQLKLSIHPKYLNTGQLDNGVVVGITDNTQNTKQALSYSKSSKPITKTKVCDVNNHCIVQFGN